MKDWGQLWEMAQGYRDHLAIAALLSVGVFKVFAGLYQTSKKLALYLPLVISGFAGFSIFLTSSKTSYLDSVIFGLFTFGVSFWVIGQVYLAFTAPEEPEITKMKDPILSFLEQLPNQRAVLEYGNQHPEHLTHVLKWLEANGDEEASDWLLGRLRRATTSVKLDVLDALKQCGDRSALQCLKQMRDDAHYPVLITRMDTILKTLQTKYGQAAHAPLLGQEN